jgi:hypothetical protein
MDNAEGLSLVTMLLKSQTHLRQATSLFTEERADTLATTKRDRPSLINIILQDPKDTVKLIEDTLNIKVISH